VKQKYFIEQFLTEEYMHGGITCVDAEKVFLANGFEPVLFPYHHSYSIKAKIGRLYFLLKSLFRIRKGSVVIFITPVYARMNKLLVTRLARKKDVQLICFIADINGIKDGNDDVLQEEIRFYKHFRYFIVHNDKMTEWVHANIAADAVTRAVEFFDFFTKPVNLERNLSFDIVFAGNLEKSPFLRDLHLLKASNPSLHFHLYGPGKTDAMTAQDNVTYHGAEKPYDLPPKLTGSYGLLWDDGTIDKPGGSLGHYMQFISHHKLSLYILSKLPIIVPAVAASAPLIEKYGIGFSIDSLYEIEEKIKRISPGEFQQMQKNMIPLAEKISGGKCLGNALDEMLKNLSDL
jgi:hypothetical protein